MLSGPEQLEWIQAFSAAFSRQEFADLLFHRLNVRMDDYAPDGVPRPTAFGAVIDAFSMRGWEGRLIAAAIEARPGNAALLRLATAQRAAAAPRNTEVERLIRDTNAFLDIDQWLCNAGRLQVCVCRIEITTHSGAIAYGTGFLIAEDLLMTNYHVMEPVIASEDGHPPNDIPRASAADVVCRFDYKVLANGGTNAGVVVKLAQNWRVALSPNNTEGTEPTVNELDFAVVRLADPIGRLPIGNAPAAPGDPRGFIELPRRFVPEFKPHSPLFIIQHPKAEPLKLALDTDAIQGVNAARTRVRYNTSTEPGSSGSPCFDQNWKLVALHHAGDPDYRPTYNEGIPIDAIVNRLIADGVVAGGNP